MIIFFQAIVNYI